MDQGRQFWRLPCLLLRPLAKLSDSYHTNIKAKCPRESKYLQATKIYKVNQTRSQEGCWYSVSPKLPMEAIAFSTLLAHPTHRHCILSRITALACSSLEQIISSSCSGSTVSSKGTQLSPKRSSATCYNRTKNMAYSHWQDIIWHTLTSPKGLKDWKAWHLTEMNTTILLKLHHHMAFLAEYYQE